MNKPETYEVWICDQCGAKHWPQVAAAAKKCPTCGNVTGKVEKVKAE